MLQSNETSVSVSVHPDYLTIQAFFVRFVRRLGDLGNIDFFRIFFRSNVCLDKDLMTTGGSSGEKNNDLKHNSV